MTVALSSSLCHVVDIDMQIHSIGAVRGSTSTQYTDKERELEQVETDNELKR